MPEEHARRWEECEAGVRGVRSVAGCVDVTDVGRLGEGVDKAYADLEAWLDDRECEEFGGGGGGDTVGGPWSFPPEEWELDGGEHRQEAGGMGDVAKVGNGAGPMTGIGSDSHFMAAKTFGGAISGCVFKLGCNGLGYYREEMGGTGKHISVKVSAEVAESEGREDDRGPLVTIRLAEYLGIEVKSMATLAIESAVRGLASTHDGDGRMGGGEEVSSKGGHDRRRRGGRKSGRKRARMGVHNYGGAEQGEMTAFCSNFKEHGLWAIDQVNPNCGNGLVKYLQITTADVVCGQEVKRFKGPQCAALECTARQWGWAMAVQPCGTGPKGGPSAGTAVAARAHLGLPMCLG